LDLNELKTGIELEDKELYKIKEIVGHKIIKGALYYRIKWEGYPSLANT